MLSNLAALYIEHAAILAFILGALVGSFLNVVIYRLPRGMSIVRPRSSCPECGDMIPGYLNVPILSWIVLLGRCRKCKAKISIRYPLVELLTAFLYLASVSRFGVSWAALAAILLSSGLVVITFVDLDIWEIPDEISIPGIVIGCALRPFAFDAPWFDGLLGAAVGAAILGLVRWFYFVVRKQEGMGLGDLKLIAMTGAFLGLRSLVPTIMVASITGTIIGGLALIFGKKPPPEIAAPPDPKDTVPSDTVPSDKEEEEDEEDWTPPENAVPFGPFLAIGAMTQLFLGDVISLAFARAFG
jgi:leader peptidase (prepilin peptidase)/N-methyltransferase